MEGSRNILSIAGAIVILLVVVVGGGLGSCAAYNSIRVWNAETAGEAELAQATSNRRIRVLEAQAKMDSASLESRAEVARARGLAEANRIVANSLGGPEGYLRYLYIQNLEQSEGQIIYVPTEGGLQITATARLSLDRASAWTPSMPPAPPSTRRLRMDREKLLKLAERCEQAKGPDFRLDLAWNIPPRLRSCPPRLTRRPRGLSHFLQPSFRSGARHEKPDTLSLAEPPSARRRLSLETLAAASQAGLAEPPSRR